MLNREVVERLGELLAKATPGKFVGRMRKDESIYVSVGDPLNGPHAQGDVYLPHADVEVMVAAVNALPELLRVYRLWMEAPSGEVGYLCTDDASAECHVYRRQRFPADMIDQRVRLVRDGDSGEGES